MPLDVDVRKRQLGVCYYELGQSRHDHIIYYLFRYDIICLISHMILHIVIYDIIVHHTTDHTKMHDIHTDIQSISQIGM